MKKNWVSIGAASAFLAVALGAFGAHSLNARLSIQMIEIFQTGVHYQMIHALGLIALGLWYRTETRSKKTIERQGTPVDRSFTTLQHTGWLFSVGTLLFSGSLYTLALTGVRALGMITPLGGLCFLAGWLCFALGTRN